MRSKKPTLDHGSIPFACERIPTLREMLELTKGKTIAVIEVKPEDITEKVVEEIEQASVVDEVVLQSFHPGVVRRSQELNRTSFRITGMVQENRESTSEV